MNGNGNPIPASTDQSNITTVSEFGLPAPVGFGPCNNLKLVTTGCFEPSTPIVNLYSVVFGPTRVAIESAMFRNHDGVPGKSSSPCVTIVNPLSSVRGSKVSSVTRAQA